MQFQNNPGDQEEKIRRFFRTNSPWIVRVFPGTGDAVSDSRDRISMIHNFDETDILFCCCGATPPQPTNYKGRRRSMFSRWREPLDMYKSRLEFNHVCIRASAGKVFKY